MTYLLLILVLVLWAVVFRKVFSHLGKNDTVAIPEQRPVEQKQVTVDTGLLLDYRDPFLEEVRPRALPSQRNDAPVNAFEPEFFSEPPQPPPLQFKGLIQKGKTVYAVVTAGVSSELVLRGDMVAGYRVQMVTADSLVVQKEREIFTLYPQ